VEKYGVTRQATDDNIIRRMRFACWITKATDKHTLILYNTYCLSTSTMVTLTLLSQCYVTRALPVLFSNEKKKSSPKLTSDISRPRLVSGARQEEGGGGETDYSRGTNISRNLGAASILYAPQRLT
jgi:hypothetical protein